jgi:hypothetical protein
MNIPDITTEPAPTIEPSSSFADFILNRLHVFKLRRRLEINLIDAVGIALEGGAIDAEGALEMLDEGGLLSVIEASSGWGQQ